MKLIAFSPLFSSHSCADTPVFLAKPPIGFFTDYEIGPVYEVDILFLYSSHPICFLIFKKSLLWKFSTVHKTREKTITTPHVPNIQLQQLSTFCQCGFIYYSYNLFMCASICTCMCWSHVRKIYHVILQLIHQLVSLTDKHFRK